MKKWETPSVNELNISDTAHKFTGIYRDGGYVGDGIVSGHLSWVEPGSDDKHHGGCGNKDNPTEKLS